MYCCNRFKQVDFSFLALKIAVTISPFMTVLMVLSAFKASYRRSFVRVELALLQ